MDNYEITQHSDTFSTCNLASKAEYFKEDPATEDQISWQQYLNSDSSASASFNPSHHTTCSKKGSFNFAPPLPYSTDFECRMKNQSNGTSNFTNLTNVTNMSSMPMLQHSNSLKSSKSMIDAVYWNSNKNLVTYQDHFTCVNNSEKEAVRTIPVTNQTREEPLNGSSYFENFGDRPTLLHKSKSSACAEFSSEEKVVEVTKTKSILSTEQTC